MYSRVFLSSSRSKRKNTGVANLRLFKAPKWKVKVLSVVFYMTRNVVLFIKYNIKSSINGTLAELIS